MRKGFCMMPTPGMVFNWLLGNTDAHVKNFSLLYSPDLRRVRLAPAYDLVSTAAYRQSTREMAFYIGDALLLDDVTEDAFRQAARDVGLGELMAMRRFDEMCRRFKPALHESAEELIAAGYDKAAELEARILQSGGTAKRS
jgi:serine/threonine-protein kinase HipA